MIAVASLAVVYGLSVQAPSPNVAVGGEVALSAWERLVDAGLSLDGFWFPVAAQTSLGLGAGAFVRLAPLPGDWGRRFYLNVRVSRTVATGLPTFNALTAGGGLGYRHPLEQTPFGAPGHWYVETGLSRAFLFKYAEAAFLVDFLKTGLTF